MLHLYARRAGTLISILLLGVTLAAAWLFAGAV
jgi:hypothetical protein